MLNFEHAELRALPRRPDITWQGAYREADFAYRDGDGRPVQPWIGLWLDVTTQVVAAPSLRPPSEAEPGQMYDAFVKAATGDGAISGYLPGRLVVSDSDVADCLRDRLAGLGVEVAEGPTPQVDAVLAELFKTMGEQAAASKAAAIPGPLSRRGVTPEHLRAFAEAARTFYEAAPWRELTDEDLIKIDVEKIPNELRYTVVLGAGGETFGLVFYSAEKQHWETRRTTDVQEWMERRNKGIWTLQFGPVSELPPADAMVWEAEQLPVAGEQAYPLLAKYLPSGEIERATPKVLDYVTGLLRALAQTTGAEIDSGKWTATVRGPQGLVVYGLELPDVVNPPDWITRFRRGAMPDPRANEATMARIHRLIQSRGITNIDDANALIQRELARSSSGEKVDAPPQTPMEQAQELCYEAFNASGRRELQLARQALEIFPDCTDAYVILAERESDPEKALALFEKGVAAAERTLGPKRLKDDVGHFWGLLDTRPYMRARYGLACTLADLERFDEAIVHCQALLELNPNDNQGVRHALLPLLVENRRTREALELLNRYDDPAPLWLYARALVLYAREGDSSRARAALVEAIQTNPHIQRSIATGDVPAVVRGSDPPPDVAEAMQCIEEFVPMLVAVPGGRDWIANARALPRVTERPRYKHRKPKKRKRR